VRVVRDVYKIVPSLESLISSGEHEKEAHDWSAENERDA
jgi:hypothetical protein